MRIGWWPSGIAWALDLVVASRERWQEDARQYAARRSAAKRRGQRLPPAGEPNPAWPRYGYGAPVEAAVYAVKHWRRTRARRGLVLPLGDRAVAELDGCLTVFLETDGRLDAEQGLLVTTCADELESRLTYEAIREDGTAYSRNQSLLGIARLIEAAARIR
ncbi:hypothetical protein [Amycolatopsis sp. H20-H5]|uniref:hypothetical protein n=1 Tax=Amycolatopsis sp. H20-H5 TaxID=3046309 RepID=UPI002DB5D48B|nr:hypothetical protein [Amycolatopsis sp. H20-H5]MEC3978667.1 hypothetical protein [Amycolatopsis sp. H20-H5]